MRRKLELAIVLYPCLVFCKIKNFISVFFLYFSPHYFKSIKISALALLKMVMHARSGGNLEVMGLLLGKVGLLYD